MTYLAQLSSKKAELICENRNKIIYSLFSNYGKLTHPWEQGDPSRDHFFFTVPGGPKYRATGEGLLAG